DALLCVLGPAPDDSGLGAPSGSEATVSGGLGELFLFWEHATAIAGYSIGVNPFDQPAVEEAKAHARQLPDQPATGQSAEAVFREGEVDVIETVGEATDLVSALRELFEQVDEYGYVAVQAYLDRLADADAAELRPLVSAHAG